MHAEAGLRFVLVLSVGLLAAFCGCRRSEIFPVGVEFFNDSGQSGEPRTGVRGWGLSVARAFQPEICPLLLDRLEIAAQGLVLCGQFVSREAEKRRSWRR